MRMISLVTNYNSFFVRYHSDTAAFAPDLKLDPCVFDFCHFHCSFRFHLAYPVAFESVKRPRRCRRMSAIVSGRQPTEVDVFLLLRCGRTKWARPFLCRPDGFKLVEPES